tara:strand:+ start:550 stop:2097 length:1548 start_codon:yes stop_codon:yes gene_type:complete
MRKRRLSFGKPKLSITENYRTYLAKLLSHKIPYSKFNWFAEILTGLRVKENADIDTFCISIQEGYYLMQYSPTMVEELTPFGAGLVIAHELGHPTLGHTTRMLRIENLYSERPELRHKLRALMHTSADYALNSWLIDVSNVFTLGDLKTKVGRATTEASAFRDPLGSYAGIHPSDVGLPPRRSMEYYMHELSKRVAAGAKPEELVNLGGNGDLDALTEGAETTLREALEAMTGEQLNALANASGESDSNSQLDEIKGRGGASEDAPTLNEVLRNLDNGFDKLVRESYEASKSRGTMPGALASWLEKKLAAPTVNWRDVLRSLTRTKPPKKRKRSMARQKRRDLGCGFLEWPGKQKDPTHNIVFAVDTSGSVSNAELKEIWAELCGLLSEVCGIEITVIQCDTSITKVYTLEGSVQDQQKVYGRGGTDFNPVFQWLINDGSSRYVEKAPPAKVDLLIYATDGECPLPREELQFLPHNKVLWLLTSRGQIPNNTYRSTRPTELYGACDYGNYLWLKP